VIGVNPTDAPAESTVSSLTSDENIIQIDHLTKTFNGARPVIAVNDVSFSVKKGEIFGLLGPNGAGKSTLIRILTTLLHPTSGTARVGPYRIDQEPEQIRSIIGVCPQNSTLDVELSAYDNLEFYGKLVNVDDRILDARIRELLKMTDLTDRMYSKVSTFSGGMRRKLEIVRAFIHHPLILFLDEPTIGLDPESRREVWQQIALLNEEETTIILTTHYMDEAEKLCNRIAFVDKGRLIALDTLENLKQLLPEGDLIEIGCEELEEGLISAIRNTPEIHLTHVKGKKLIISAHNGSRALPHIYELFEEHSVPVTSLLIHSPSLEDVFIHLSGKKLDEGDEPKGNNSRRRRP
jgi:ABC-2 type transport system ATP-binding protein